MDNTLLTYEDFHPLLTEIEGVLNSRPLCPIFTDPNDAAANNGIARIRCTAN